MFRLSTSFYHILQQGKATVKQMSKTMNMEEEAEKEAGFTMRHCTPKRLPEKIQ